MRKRFAQLVFWLFGWRLKVENVDGYTPSVMIAAPHTTNWDFIFSIGAFWQMGIPLRYFIKDAYTRSLFGFFFKWSGAIGVDRSKKGSGLTDYAVELLQKNRKLVILVPAEGTRKRVDKWRTGFYRIALEANVPISLGYLDYAKKEAGVLLAFQPTGEFEKDMQFIQEQYSRIAPKHPENYNPQIY